MYPSFVAAIRHGKIEVDELDERVLEGKHVAVVLLDTNDDNQVTGGEVRAGVYQGKNLAGAEGRTSLDDAEGRQAFVILRHDLLGPISPEAFGQKFQLGAKLGDLDT
jgi:hypothetical protein